MAVDRRAGLDREVTRLALLPAHQRDEGARELVATARDFGVWPASIAPVYRALAERAIPAMTVPAMNLRGLTYYSARAAWRAALKSEAGPIIFELAPSEAEVGDQPFAEYAAMVLAAAAREGYCGPVFLQGDHFGLYDDDSSATEQLHDKAREAVDAGFYQIDIDAAALASEAGTPGERQRRNARATAGMIESIRGLRSDAVVGGEVGEIGGRNTTAEDLRSFLDEVARALPSGANGLSKVSIQTGTRHGGIVGEDGTVGEMPLDIELARELSGIARDEYGLPGVVQHGASTLRPEQMSLLPHAGVIEVHLATGIQNLILDHPAVPAGLVERMKRELAGPVAYAESGEYGDAELSAAQVYYQNRWQAWGRFKRELWQLDDDVKAAIGATLEEWFAQLFQALGVAGCRNVLELVKE